MALFPEDRDALALACEVVKIDVAEVSLRESLAHPGRQLLDLRSARRGQEPFCLGHRPRLGRERLHRTFPPLSDNALVEAPAQPNSAMPQLARMVSSPSAPQPEPLPSRPFGFARARARRPRPFGFMRPGSAPCPHFAVCAEERERLAGSRATGRVRRAGAPGVFIKPANGRRHHADRQRAAAWQHRDLSRPYLWARLEGDKYVVERFRSAADGQIRPVPIAAPAARGKRRRPRHTVTSLTNVKKMRPASDEIIVCTAVNLEDSGVQYWGTRAIWGHMMQRR